MGADAEKYDISKNVKLSKHFWSNNFKCNDGSKEVLISKDLVEALEVFYAYGLTVKMICGYRSEAYNAKIGGAEKSQHLIGKAADFQLLKDGKVISVEDMCKLAEIVGFDGIGRMNTSIHADVRGYKTYFDELAGNTRVYNSKGKNSFFLLQLEDDWNATETEAQFRTRYPRQAAALGDESHLIKDFAMTSVASNSFTATAELKKEYSKYDWYYKLNGTDKKPLSLNSEKPTITLNNLAPDTAYSVYLVALHPDAGDFSYENPDVEDGLAEADKDFKDKMYALRGTTLAYVSQTLYFRTSSLTAVTAGNVSVSFEQNDDYKESKCSLSFSSPPNWPIGDCGYRILLLRDNTVLGYSDNMLSNSTTSKEFKLKELMNNQTINYGDVFQIGIQPWYKYNNEKIIEPNRIACSQPFAIQAKLSRVDKLFITKGENLKRCVVHVIKAMKS